MGGKSLLNKKLMLFAIFLVSLLAISAVNAADNATGDVICADDELDEIALSEIAKEDEAISSIDSSDSISALDDEDNLTYGENGYSEVYVDSLNGYYGGKNVIKYGWKGNLNGNFEIYKGGKLVYEKTLNAKGNGYHDETYEGSAINAVGTYKAVITDQYGDTLAQATIKINKAPTHTLSPSFSTKIGAYVYIYAGISDTKEEKIYETSGKAKFKIAGKTYNAKFKKGIAQIKVKMPLKAKTYKCTVKFLGNSNYKSSTGKFTIKLNSGNVAILKKNRSIKVGKYTIKLTSSQYRSLVKAFNKDKSKNFNFKTKYNYKVKVPYTKAVKKYKTTKAVKTWYAGSYMPMINEMRANGWTKVSEYTYNEPNPRNQYGIGLSSYTIAVCKWVKVTYKTAYKTKYYPIKAAVTYKKGTIMPWIDLYSRGKTITWKYIAIA